MAVCNVQDLIAEACASGFKCVNEVQFRLLLLQLLCNLDAELSGGGGHAGGTSVIANGVATGNVVFAPPLAAAPTAVVVTVERATGALNLYATLTNSPGVGGFTYELNGVTDTADYVLHWMAFLP